MGLIYWRARLASHPPRLVNDLAHLLQPQEADALEQKLVAYNDSTSSQIAVVTVPTRLHEVDPLTCR